MHHDACFSGRFRAMKELSSLPGRRSRRARFAAAAAIAVALGVTSAPVGALDGDHDHDHGTTTSSSATECPPAKAKALRKAGDNFAKGCLPGEDIAQLDDSEANLKPGESASSKNLKLIANIPKQGAFAQEASFNSDLAFKGNYAYAGNYDGFMVYDIKKPKQAEGGHPGRLPGLPERHLGVPATCWCSASTPAATTTPAPARRSRPSDPDSWEGVRVFDISNPANPRYVAAVETDCGSHTHSLAPTKNGRDVYVYVSSYGPNAAFPDCQPPHDKISIIKVPANAPQDASAGRHAGALPRRRQPVRRLLAGDRRLPRHHGLPEQGHRRRRLHG